MNELNTRLQGKGTFAHSTEGIQGEAKTVFSPAQSEYHNTLSNTRNYGTTDDVNSEVHQYDICTRQWICSSDFQKLAAEFDILSSRLQLTLKRRRMLYSWNWLICTVTIYSLYRWLNMRLRYWISNPDRQGLHFPISSPPTGEVAHPWYFCFRPSLFWSSLLDILVLDLRYFELFIVSQMQACHFKILISYIRIRWRLCACMPPRLNNSLLLLTIPYF